jgi:hypothetical protein
VVPLARPISYHTPYVIQVTTHISKSYVFRSKNYWVQFYGFRDTIELHWHTTPFYDNSTRILCGKFKQVRRGLKRWSRDLSKLNENIHNCSWVIALLDGLENARALSQIERNFRKIVKTHMGNLLEAKRIYWKQKATIRFVKFGD